MKIVDLPNKFSYFCIALRYTILHVFGDLSIYEYF